MWRNAGSVLLVGVWLGAGCAHYRPEPLAPASTAARFESRSLADPGLRVFIETQDPATAHTWPPAAWDYRTLTLAAFYFHPDLDVARARWAVAAAGQRTAGERPNPTLSVTPAYNTSTAIPSPWLVTPTLDVPLETAGKRGYRMAQAARLSEAARLNVATVAWQVRSRVRNAVAAVYFARQTCDLLARQLSLQADAVSLLASQQQAGAVSAFEVNQARVAWDASHLALRDADLQKAEGWVQLAEAVGVPADVLGQVKISFEGAADVPSDLSVVELRRQALLSRTDILAALADYAASESALQLEIAKQYPDVHLSPGYEFDQGDSKWSLGFSVTLPVLHHNQGAIAEAEARRAEAAAVFEALQARVLMEIDRAAAGYGAALQRMGDTDAMQVRAGQQEQAARAMKEAGAMARSEVVALRLQAATAGLAGLESRAKAVQAFGALEDAVQRPLSPGWSSLSFTDTNATPRNPREK